ncbi:glycosyltransferase family 9 protein [Pseudogulbenkiania sp. MAI-1]|uniref:glycosyltransferase family 9 protein n=1 Tax=Pseudogulbenkiania sp. MAI-1 TaxID=990370 RepID=UPI00045E99A2|nr:glycosyltransferase family 9 protein [Pseudogulbenkiania sp. MAI-1]
MFFLLLTWLVSPLLAIRLLLARKREPERILLIQTAKIGDMLCATPIILALKARYPEAHLTVLHAPVTHTLIAGLPEVDQCLPVQSRDWKGLSGKFRLARLLAAGKHDMAIVLSPNLPLLLALCWAGIPRRLSLLPTRPGRSYRWAAPLLSDHETHGGGELVLDTVRRLLNRQGIDLGFSKTMSVADSGEKVCRGLGLDREGQAIGIAVSSANKLKELGEEKLRDLLGELLVRFEVPVVLIGGGEDGAQAARLCASLNGNPRLIDATGRFRLDELPALMQRLRVFVGVDSGLTYLADTFDIPIVSIVGPTDPREQRPLGKNVRFVIQRPACYPCAFVFKAPYACHTGTRECVLSVRVEDIVEQIMDLGVFLPRETRDI